MHYPQIVADGSQIKLGERIAVTFHRTLRVPEDGVAYPLPAGLGTFPVVSAAVIDPDHRPEGFGEGDAMIPMHQHEALWIGIHAAQWKPNALVVSLGGINAISGRRQGRGSRLSSQDYLVCPPQLWLDGINTGPGTVRQFVASRLGGGLTVEAAMTGTESQGGLRLTSFEPLAGLFQDQAPIDVGFDPAQPVRGLGRPPEVMGLGAGGQIVQKIYPDEHGIQTWDQAESTTIVVRLVGASDFERLTGEVAPPSPIDRATYEDLSIPWFELDDEQSGDVAAPPVFENLPTRSGDTANEPTPNRAIEG